jgi:hypothetical protein
VNLGPRSISGGLWQQTRAHSGACVQPRTQHGWPGCWPKAGALAGLPCCHGYNLQAKQQAPKWRPTTRASLQPASLQPACIQTAASWRSAVFLPHERQAGLHRAGLHRAALAFCGRRMAGVLMVHANLACLPWQLPAQKGDHHQPHTRPGGCPSAAATVPAPTVYSSAAAAAVWRLGSHIFSSIPSAAWSSWQH